MKTSNLHDAISIALLALVAGMAGSACPLRLPKNSSRGSRPVEMSYVTIRARIAEDQDERRTASRLPVELEAKMRELGASGVEARVLNISERGFMAVADGRFEVGSRVWLMLPGRERANAVVKWIAGEKIGAEFAEPISLDGIAR